MKKLESDDDKSSLRNFFDQLTDKDIIMPFLAKTTKVIGFSSRVIIKYKYSSHKEAYVYEIKEEENLSYPYIDEIVDDFRF